MIKITSCRKPKTDKPTMIEATLNVEWHVKPELIIAVYEIVIFKKDGKRWVSMPAKKVEREGQEKPVYYAWIKVMPANAKVDFEQKVLDAYDRFISEPMHEEPLF